MRCCLWPVVGNMQPARCSKEEFYAQLEIFQMPFTLARDIQQKVIRCYQKRSRYTSTDLLSQYAHFERKGGWEPSTDTTELWTPPPHWPDPHNLSAPLRPSANPPALSQLQPHSPSRHREPHLSKQMNRLLSRPRPLLCSLNRLHPFHRTAVRMDYSSVPTPERCYADFCLVPVR